MDVITREIERALSAGLYYLALVCTLSLPDICAALESPTGETTGALYKQWYAKWLTSYPDITGDDLYGLRCGVLHQGRLGHPGSQYARVLFAIPNAQQNILHQVVVNDVLELDVVIFCHDMIDAVNRWYAAKQNDSNVKVNMPRLVQYHAHGLAPYILGVPLIG